jgi:hypothetical protein
MVLCVDDAHLLDNASAALLHELSDGTRRVRRDHDSSGERAPDAIQALWKDELRDLVHLRTLSRADVQRLLEEVLCAAVDGVSVSLLWERTRGNVLFLRELVLHRVEHGLLSEDAGIWRWRSDTTVGTRLAELVAARLAALQPATLGVLEVVAVGAPLEVGLLQDADTAALEALERRGPVERSNDRRRYVDVVHPLHGEVIRARLARTRLEAIQLRLADAVERPQRISGTIVVPMLAPTSTNTAIEEGGIETVRLSRTSRHPRLCEPRCVTLLQTVFPPTVRSLRSKRNRSTAVSATIPLVCWLASTMKRSRSIHRVPSHARERVAEFSVTKGR